MNYGLISNVMAQDEIAVFKERRIPQGNLYPCSYAEALVSRLRQGDVVTIVSITIFSSIAQFVLFARAVVTANVSLKKQTSKVIDEIQDSVEYVKSVEVRLRDKSLQLINA